MSMKDVGMGEFANMISKQKIQKIQSATKTKEETKEDLHKEENETKKAKEETKKERVKKVESTQQTVQKQEPDKQQMKQQKTSEETKSEFSVFLTGKKRIDETHETASFNIRKDLLKKLNYYAKISDRVYFKREFVNYALEYALNRLEEESGITPEIDEYDE